MLNESCHRRLARPRALLIGVVATVIAALQVAAPARAQTPWSFFGGDLSNSRANLSPPSHIGSPTQINPRTAPTLAVKWVYTTVGDVQATPTVEPGGLYVPDNAGYLYKLDPDTGQRIWSRSLSEFVGGAYASTRNSPAIGAMGEIVFGLATGFAGEHPGARVISLDKTTGNQRWQTIVDTTTHSYITASPVIYNGRVYVGVASNEEELAGRITPTFRGSVLALSEATGEILWKFNTVPVGYTGASVWGSHPVVWTPGNALLFGTGNNITMPAGVSRCVVDVGTDVTKQLGCLDPTDYVDSLLSLDLVTGRVNWSRRFEVDAWTSGCPRTNCPAPAGKDHDFAQGPSPVYLNNFTGVPDDRGGSSRGILLAAGQKSGYYRGLNPYNGGLFWSTFLGNGELLKGSAIDLDTRDAAYVSLFNDAHYENKLFGQNGVPVYGNGGAWASVTLSNGHVNWQIPAYGRDLTNPGVEGASPGAVTFTNRVIFVASTSGYMVALDSATGNRLWTFNAGGAVVGGPSIYDETVFWGAGAVPNGRGTVHKLYAFAVPAPRK